MTKKIGADWVTNNEFFSFTKLKKKTINFSNRIFYACYEKIPDAMLRPPFIIDPVSCLVNPLQ